MKEARRDRVGLVFTDLTCFPAALLDALAISNAHATFIVAPDLLVQEAAEWRNAVVSGHELANGALVDVTLDGRVENWPPKALEAELGEVDQLLHELGQDMVVTGYLPGEEHIDEGGDYREYFQSRYPVCFSDIAESMSVGGQSLPIVGIGLESLPAAPFVLRLSGTQDELSQLRHFLSAFDAVSLSELHRILGEAG